MRSAARTGYVHDALYFASEQDLTDQAAPFLRAGLDAGEAAVLACSSHHAGLLLEALDRDARVGVLPAEEMQQHAPRALAAYARLVRDEVNAGTPRVRLVREAAVGPDSDSWLEWLRFEALCNRVLDGLPLWSLCAYDRRALPPEALVSAGVTHPNLVDGGGRRPNPLYVDPAEVLTSQPDEAPDPLEAGPPDLEVPHVADLQPLRQAVRDACESALPADSVDDFVLAVGEVVTNGLRHGRPPVQVRMWSVPGRVVCTVTDQGAGVVDPFAGYMPVGREGPLHGGMGLWLARQLCHRLQMWRSPGGFTVRLTGC